VHQSTIQSTADNSALKKIERYNRVSTDLHAAVADLEARVKNLETQPVPLFMKTRGETQ
jgi:hypothetical protein